MHSATKFLGGHSDLIAGLAVARGDYAELFHASIGDRVVRRPETQDVRVRIFGPLEARLQSFQRVVLGGLNEGSWPPETRSDPWLSRPMRRDLGLDPPERRIGLSAHDFAQALGAPEVILSRAAKLAGAPTVASRFVQRLAAEVQRVNSLDEVKRFLAEQGAEPGSMGPEALAEFIASEHARYGRMIREAGIKAE